MTGTLLKEWDTTGQIRPLFFWARIVRRIVPMAMVVLLLTAIGTLWLVPASLWRNLQPEFLYSALNLENIELMERSVDYLVRDEAPSPVQQFWALSSQMQFFLVWPLILMGAARATARLHIATDTGLAIAVAVVVVVSLTLSVLMTPVRPAPSYFNPALRIWEFAVGGLCTLWVRRRSFRPLAPGFGWLGFGLILSCGFIVPRSIPYPGWIAVLPVSSCVLLLLNSRLGKPTGVGKLLAARSIQWLGNFSFGFYLWHWPVLVLLRHVRDGQQLGVLDGIAVIGASFLGAYLSSCIIEQPLQQLRWLNGRPLRVMGSAALVTLPVLFFVVLWYRYTEEAVADVASRMAYPSALYPGAAEAPGLTGAPRRDYHRQLIGAKLDIPEAARAGCHQSIEGEAVRVCSYRPAGTSRKTLALVGGSHSGHWQAALQPLIDSDSITLVVITKSACPLEANTLRDHPSCLVWNDKVIGKIDSIRPDYVLTTLRRSVRYGDGQYVPGGYVEQWKKLNALGIPVLAFRDVPSFTFDVTSCLARPGRDATTCFVSRESGVGLRDSIRELAKIPNFVVSLDLTDLLCTPTICPSVIGGLVVYRDNQHLTASFARSMASMLRALLKAKRVLSPSAVHTDSTAS